MFGVEAQIGSSVYYRIYFILRYVKNVDRGVNAIFHAFTCHLKHNIEKVRLPL